MGTRSLGEWRPPPLSLAAAVLVAIAAGRSVLETVVGGLVLAAVIGAFSLPRPRDWLLGLPGVRRLSHRKPPNSAPNASATLTAPKELPTQVRLQFFGDTRIPVCVTSENVINWYANLTTFHLNGAPHSFCWQVFLVFDTPVKYHQVIVTHSHPELAPTLEVKYQTHQCTVVFTNGQIPAGILTIVAEGALTLPNLRIEPLAS